MKALHTSPHPPALQQSFDFAAVHTSSAAKHKDAGIAIGCAGWSVPGAAKENFPEEGSHLERYAKVFSAVEINSSFYRPHRPASYARWRDSVPETFRFSAKLPKRITHELRLKDVDEPLRRFVDEVGHLGHKLGCLLVQLPPSLRYDAPVAEAFFASLRSLVAVDIVCEPRHPSWFAEDAAAILAAARVAYVDADPPAKGQPATPPDAATAYVRLHGSPHIYYSAYSDDYLDRLAADLLHKAHAGKRVWCIFDNTASGAAVFNALALMARLRGDDVEPAG